MVFFVCDKCGESMRKSQVQKHGYACSSNAYSCIDCQVVFNRHSYVDHIKCISENQKYGGANYVEKEKKGEVRQNLWVEQVSQAIVNVSKTGDTRLKKILLQVQGASNIPRKEAKFINFMKNSMRVRDDSLLKRAWDSIKAAVNTPTEVCAKMALKSDNNGNVESEIAELDVSKSAKKTTNDVDDNAEQQQRQQHDNGETNDDSAVNDNGNNADERNAEASNNNDASSKTSFKWKSAIKRKLRDALGDDPNAGVKYKRLRREVIDEYRAAVAALPQNTDASVSLEEAFDERIMRVKGIRIDGKRVYFAQ